MRIQSAQQNLNFRDVNQATLAQFTVLLMICIFMDRYSRVEASASVWKYGVIATALLPGGYLVLG